MNLDQLLALVLAHKYLALVALLASYGSTLLSPASAFPLNLSKRARVGLVFGFAFLGATITSFQGSGQDVKTWAATWLLHGALATFLSLGGYAALVTVAFNGNPPAWLKALAFIVPDSKGPPEGGSPASYRTNAKAEESEQEEKTQPSAAARIRSWARYVAIPRVHHVAIAAALSLVGIVCVVQVNACKQSDLIIHDLQPAASCIVNALADGGTEDPMVIVAECAGTTIEDIIKVISDLLSSTPDAGQDAAVGLSPSYRSHLIRTLENAYHVKAQAAGR